ncbi:hydroxyacylglutathione hydrolase [Haliangium sp.]|uniref:hydroxyacylglutathione hydrolase n=1 Tax=Haliangium sp. TaxID=2663208 RepID=UPI003D11AD35
MRIVAVPCLRDNYAYLVVCEATNQAAVVDPSEAAPVLAAVEREQVELAAIWNTHHHWDHIGGNEALVAAHPGLTVVAHSSDKGRVPGQTRFVDHGDEVTLGQELAARIIFNPGHTSGAISYYLAEHKAVFTGDTLFLAGCGRLFEGTPAQMHESLSRLAALPGDTRVYCGHEYTASNLRFAAAVEPDNEAVRARASQVESIRAEGRPSVPGTMAAELATNPFLRVSAAEVIAAAQKHADNDDVVQPADIFRELRGWKDKF